MTPYTLGFPLSMAEWETRFFLNVFTNPTKERNTMQVTSETKAVLKTEGTGRVIGFVKSNEPGKISIAVPNDRALMIPAQARQLAAWLVSEAEKAEKVMTTAARTSEGWRTAEARRQSEIRAALDRDRVGYRRAY
ncbi:hypothetical protein [Streptomyces sp. MMBL 11-1]|uniref:hypothetical protein n=1 Tax=Streptomyces sp. MMBL 11-1 TaxID=3026420 RepID=UPI0023613229|nr:hypothetical protein [Streptomyces sp. MMBL 11-1]